MGYVIPSRKKERGERKTCRCEMRHANFSLIAIFSLATLTSAATFTSPGASAGPTFKLLYPFKLSSDGGFPEDGVIADRAGNLYGTTVGGGYVYGTIFMLTPPS